MNIKNLNHYLRIRLLPNPLMQASSISLYLPAHPNRKLRLSICLPTLVSFLLCVVLLFYFALFFLFFVLFYSSSFRRGSALWLFFFKLMYWKKAQFKRKNSLFEWICLKTRSKKWIDLLHELKKKDTFRSVIWTTFTLSRFRKMTGYQPTDRPMDWWI